MTSMETPRLLSEYFAARAQSVARISACPDVDVASVRIKNPLQPLRCAKRNHDEPFMRVSCRRQADGYDSGVVAGVDDRGPPASPRCIGATGRAFGRFRFRNSATLGKSSRLRRPK